MQVCVKICGLRREEDVRYVNEYLPEYIGFIFAAGRRRTIDKETARRLKGMLNPKIKAVGVFVNDNPKEIIELLKEGIIDMAQLHGDEDEQTVAYIKAESGKEVIKAVIFKEGEEANQLLRWNASDADFLLFDSGTGSGKTFDWNLLGGDEAINKPFFLAGGMTPENAGEALFRIASQNLYALDISSGVETDGYKDKEKIALFIEAVRGAAR